MGYNKNNRSTIYGELVKSGSDLLKSMYQARIYFPKLKALGRGASDEFTDYQITTRISAFDIPDPEIATYEITYLGNKMLKPNGTITFDRKFDLTFREDG